jgi:PAS domain S-box-containing protein
MDANRFSVSRSEAATDPEPSSAFFGASESHKGFSNHFGWHTSPFLFSISSIGLTLLIVFMAGYLLRAQARARNSELMEKARLLEHEIQERTSIEEALQNSESQYRSVFENTGTATIIVDDEKTITIANSEFERLSGYPREEIEGRMAWTRFVHADDLNRIKEYHEARKLREGSVPSEYEFRFVNRNGQVRHILNRVCRIPGGSKTVASLLDITERKQTELALKRSEEKYRNILQSIVEGYYEVDLRGDFTLVNEAICHIFDYPRETLLQMNLKDFTDAENARRGHEAFLHVYETGETLKAYEWCIQRKDGMERHVEASVSLMRDDQNHTCGFRGILHDVTERKLAEEERNGLALQLKQAQKMEALGTLAGGIAHNFNNLLMGIQGYTSLLLLESNLDESRRKMLESIQRQVRSGSRLTTQLLGYAREGNVSTRPFGLNELIQDTMNTFGATRKDIVIHADLDKNLCPILADHGQIEQTLMNLLINAGEAMPHGGEITLRARNASPHMMEGKPYTPKPGPYVLLSVTDTGIGMSRETQERIFEPFFTTKGLVNGTGLGLSSVYGIVKAHGGYIDVESKPDQGATFLIFLPASREVVPADSKDPQKALHGTERILIVDDEGIVLEVAGHMLRQLGYQVVEAQNGHEALEIYQRDHDIIDLVIFDMIMPEMSGHELFEKIQATDPQTRTLLSSGYSLNDEARKILEVGCDGFIQKPFDLRELSRKVRTLLDA